MPDLLPILSWLMLRGRCRSCAALIGNRPPLIEGSAALIGAVCCVLAPEWEGLPGALFGWQLLALGLFDARHYRLPHIMTATLALSGLAAAQLAGPPLPERLIGGAAGWAMLALVGTGYSWLRGRKGLGGGDAPMFGAIGCWLGWSALPPVLLLAGLAGLGIVAARLAQGQRVTATDRLPLGTLLAGAALSYWIAATYFQQMSGVAPGGVM